MDPRTGRRKQSKGDGPRSTLTANGRVSVTRTRWQCPGGAGGGDTPVDRLLDAAEATISRGARELCCLLNENAPSFARAAQNLLRTTGVRLCAESLRRAVEGEGVLVLERLASGALRPDWGAADCKDPSGHSRIYLGCDGFTAAMVTAAEKKLRRKKVRDKRRSHARRKLPPDKPEPDKPEPDKPEPDKPEPDKPEPRPLPAARAGADQKFKEFKLVTFYDESATHRLVSVTRRDHHAAGRLMRRDGGRCGFAHADQRPAVVDGGPWIVNQIKRQSIPTTAICLDFFHLAQNVHKARRDCFGEQNPAGLAWAADLLHVAKHQGYDPLHERLLKWRQSLRPPAKRRAAGLLLNYVTDRREMIAYPAFVKAGWQIGSGPTESQCKQVPRRVKGRGKRWDGDNAEAVMALEAMGQSGLSETYWKSCA
jgi:hypothetical protein